MARATIRRGSILAAASHTRSPSEPGTPCYALETTSPRRISPCCDLSRRRPRAARQHALACRSCRGCSASAFWLGSGDAGHAAIGRVRGAGGLSELEEPRQAWPRPGARGDPAGSSSARSYGTPGGCALARVTRVPAPVQPRPANKPGRVIPSKLPENIGNAISVSGQVTSGAELLLPSGSRQCLYLETSLIGIACQPRRRMSQR
jgi:hypothetical protein